MVCHTKVCSNTSSSLRIFPELLFGLHLTNNVPDVLVLTPYACAFTVLKLAVHCRHASSALADSHVHALHKLVMTVAICCGTQSCRHGAGSHVLRQVTQLTGHLLVAVPLDRRQKLCQSLLEVGNSMTLINVAKVTPNERCGESCML